MKSSVEQIRQRFDNDVERFSNLEIGQTTMVDGALMMDLTSQAAAAATPQARHILDVGCGAGNYALKLLQLIPNLAATLVDLSRPMLERATQRIAAVSTGKIQALQGDIRDLEIPPAQFDVILAAAVLHHLRAAEEWEAIFSKFYGSLRPGGAIWIVDLIEHSSPAVQALMWTKYGEYLTDFKDEAFRETVFGYVEEEDTPRPLMFQIDMLRRVGFEQVEILHKNNVFAAFGAMKTT